MRSLGKNFFLVPFPFLSLLTLGLSGASSAVSLPFFFDGVFRDLLSELSESSLEVVEH